MIEIYKKTFLTMIERKYFSNTIAVDILDIKEEKKIAKKALKIARNKYHNGVRAITKTIDKSSIEGYDENRLLTRDILKSIGFNATKTSELLVIDHKISLDYGFKNNIPLHVIADISNLRFIPSCENNKKGTKCFVDDNNIWIEKQYNFL